MRYNTAITGAQSKARLNNDHARFFSRNVEPKPEEKNKFYFNVANRIENFFTVGAHVLYLHDVNGGVLPLRRNLRPTGPVRVNRIYGS